MDTNLFESAARLWGHIDQSGKDQNAYDDCKGLLASHECKDTTMPGGPLPKVDYHAIEVSFGCIEDQATARYFKNLPTTFYLPPEDVDRLISEGAKILVESKDFQKLLVALNDESP